jgi:hypothetical protein
MELQENDIQLLSDFWYGRLNEQETKTLEQKLQADPIFRQSAKELFIILDGLDKKRRQEIKAHYSRNKSSDFPPKSGPKIWPIWIKMVAAFIVIALSVFFVETQFNARSETQSMIDSSYRKHFPCNDFEMGDEEKLEDLLLEYELKKYKRVAPKLAEFFNMTNDSTALLYSGVAYFLAKRDLEAVQQLTLLSKSEYYGPNANWYLALSYLSLGNKDQAKTLLKSIVHDQLPRASEAEKLLDRMR